MHDTRTIRPTRGEKERPPHEQARPNHVHRDSCVDGREQARHGRLPYNPRTGNRHDPDGPMDDEP